MLELKNPVRSRFLARGFTLIELLTTISIAAVLLAIAAPSFQQFQRNSQLTTSANALVAALGAARAEAMKRQLDVYVTPNTGGWAQGWAVWVDTALNHTYSNANEILRQQAVPSTVTVSGCPNLASDAALGGEYIKFNGAGFPQTYTNQPLTNSQVLVFSNSTESRNVLISPVGRMRAYKPTTTACTIADDW